MTDFEVYLDMDGVLADFDGRIDHDGYLKKLKKDFAQLLASFGPQYENLSMDRIKTIVKGPQTDPKMKALKVAYHNVNSRKYALANAEHFFLNLPVLPGAMDLFEGVMHLTGKKPHILTAPMDSNKQCAEEKQLWMEKNFPGMYQSFNCTKDKFKFAKGDPRNILIDDREKYVDPFNAAGGTAILYHTPNASQALEELQKTIENLVMNPTLAEQSSSSPSVLTATPGPGKNSVSYTGLVLSRADHNKLVNFVKDDVDTFANGWEILAHHVTINLGKFKGDRSLIGQTFPIHITNIAQDSLVAAVGVNLPRQEIQSSNNVPHITVAVNRAAGAKPMLSNKLDWSSAVPALIQLVLNGTLMEVSVDDDRFSDEY